MPLAGVLGAPISSLILKAARDAGGFQGWKWLFLAEGLPSVLLGISCLWLLPSKPKDAKWLTVSQHEQLEAVLGRERAQTEQIRKFTLREGITNPRVLVLAAMLFCLICGSTGIGLFLPQIVKDLGFGTAKNGLVTAIPYLLAVLGIVWWSRHSDRKVERVGHVAIAALVAALGFLVAAFMLTNPAVAITGLSLAAVGVFAELSGVFHASHVFPDRNRGGCGGRLHQFGRQSEWSDRTIDYRLDTRCFRRLHADAGVVVDHTCDRCRACVGVRSYVAG